MLNAHKDDPVIKILHFSHIFNFDYTEIFSLRMANYKKIMGYVTTISESEFLQVFKFLVKNRISAVKDVIVVV